MKNIWKWIVAVFAVSLSFLVGGWFWFEKGRGLDRNEALISNGQNQESTGEPEQIGEGVSNIIVDTSTVQEESAATWYEIPELGIRFPTTKERKEDLVYHQDPKLKTISFSEKILEQFNKECTEELGTLAKLYYGSAYIIDPNIPCVGGKKVKEFEGGYFCYFRPQSPCMTGEEYNRFYLYREAIEKSLSPSEEPKRLFEFTSDDFWKTVEVLDSKN